MKHKKELEHEYLKMSGIGRDSLRYDCIPDKYMNGHILDLGASLGINQLSSRHKERFQLAAKENRYVGVEAFIPLKTFLPIIKCDIMTYEPRRKFDLILMMDVLEHIQFRDWFVLIPRLKKWLKDDGLIILTMPYKESMKQYLNHTGYLSCHVVFNITTDIIEHFFEGANFEKSSYLQKRIIWKDNHENHFWAFGRFIKRVITRHRHSRILKYRKKLIVYWKKEISS